MVEDWRVLEDPSISDHKYISFRMDCDRNRVSGRLRNPRNTDCDRYTTVLSEMLGKPGRIILHHDLGSYGSTKICLRFIRGLYVLRREALGEASAVTSKKPQTWLG